MEKRKCLESRRGSGYYCAVEKLTFALALSLFACNDDDEQFLPSPDGGAPDAAADAALDASQLDASELDARVTDSAIPDAAQDATVIADATVDASAPIDAGGCKPTVLLQGGTDVVAQGWTVAAMSPSELSYPAGFTRIATSTNTGAFSGGALLLTRANALQVPFAIEVVLRVESVQPHNPLDSAAAILGSLTGTVGNQTERSQMVFLDSTSVGWADDTQSAAAVVVDTKTHTYVLSVDEQNVARVTVDGVAKLTRNNFTTNGTLAIGDQTNDANVDAVLQIESVTKLCP